ncbi:hypothetical protein [Flavobacterium sp.]|uniref:pirin family protein n=1 Tax=Flavobacterium sp. TaxID=239 RepID=UPI00262D909B|nr:hypothetical protein [Flavobacterium sp.]
MTKFIQQQAQIYKAHLRGHFETDIHRCLATFNFETYQEESRKPYHLLEVLNEEMLAAKETVRYSVTDNQSILIVPLAGAIDCITASGTYFIHIEECYFFSASDGQGFALQNPYENRQVNYLQIRFKTTAELELALFSFDLNQRNEMLQVIEHPDFAMRIGIFDGRKEDVYIPQNKNNGIFAFVLNGAFEFQNRLVENRDGLAIDASETIEFESLAENSMLLLFECYA